MKSPISDCRLFRLGRISNRSGNISVAESNENIPFHIKRVYYLYDIPGGVERGGHAHKSLFQVLVAAGGSFTVLIDDGRERKKILLSKPDEGLLIVPGIWRELTAFSSGAVCLVLASEIYTETDYIRDYSEFQKYKTPL